MRRVEIRYHRPPDRLDVFVQDLVVDGTDCKVTLHDPATLDRTLRVGDRVVYEPGAPIVWFVFPGAWYDVGRFHLRDGTFTGFYINLIAPPELTPQVWTLYDLCLDVWVGPDGAFRVLDRDEFDEAVDHGWIDPVTARRARAELDRVLRDIRNGRWPPDVVRRHDLARVRALRAARSP
jgi:predicted RNA-binding protein associated with RNAse of E/G family